MKKLATLLVATAAMSAAVVSTAAANATGPTQYAAGAGKINYSGNVAYASFLFAAKKDSHGTNGFFTQDTPSGQTVPAGSWTGVVTCLNVTTDKAILAGRLIRKTGQFASSGATGFEVALKGNPDGTAGMSSGTFTPYTGLLAPTTCDPYLTFTALFPLGPIASGRIFVGEKSFHGDND